MRTAPVVVPAVFAFLAPFFLSISLQAQHIDWKGGRQFTVGGDPERIVFAHLDSDDWMDAFVLDGGGQGSRTGHIMLHRGNPLGALDDGTLFLDRIDPGMLLTRDLNGDQHLDLVLSCQRSGPPGEGAIGSVVVVFHGDGTGNFNEVQQLMVGQERFLSSLENMVFLDLDLDGNIDLATSDSRYDNIHFLTGNPDGTFTLGGQLSTNGVAAPLYLAAIDLDGNQLDDLAVSARLTSSTLQREIYTFTNLGAGKFTAPAIQGSFGTPEEMIAVDIDSDLDTDLVFLDAGAVGILQSDGKGTLTLAPAVPVANPQTLDVGDLDDDKNPDLLTTSFGQILVHPGLGTGAFGTARPQFSDQTAFLAAFGDLDVDGNLDIVAFQVETFIETGVVFLGNGSQDVDVLGGAGNIGVAAEFADLDGDGNLDIVSAADCSDLISVHLGDGTGEFGPGTSFPTGPQNPQDLVIADFNGDGNLDVAVANTGFSCERFEEPIDGSLSVLLGDGSGGFGPVTTTVFPGTIGGTLLGGDFNEDTHVDLAYCIPNQNLILILLGDGAGGFTRADDLVGASPPRGGVVADWNLDGFLDIAVTSSSISSLLVHAGQGNGSFDPPVLLPADTRVKELDAADVNADGFPDLVSISSDGANVLLGDGNLGFTLVHSFDNLGLPQDVKILDIDEDGHQDLAITDASLKGVAFYQGDGTGSFEPAGRFNCGFFSVGITLGDVDRDGHVDLGVATSAEFRVAVLLNRTFHPVRCRRGTVNAATGNLADVLLLNGSAGTQGERRVCLSPADPFKLFLDAAPSRQRSTYVVYSWSGVPTSNTTVNPGFDLGLMGKIPFLIADTPDRIDIYNTIGREPRLGASTRPSGIAPAPLLCVPNGIGSTGTYYIQGFIKDRDSLNGRFSVTNGIVVELK